MTETPKIEEINAVTLQVSDMSRSVEFYRSLGFVIAYGGPNSTFTSFRIGHQALNLITTGKEEPGGGWGRVIVYVDDVDAMHRRALAGDHSPEDLPRDASWNERYFHLDDPDGHQISFAKPL